jgi:hypothetical protein
MKEWQQLSPDFEGLFNPDETGGANRRYGRFVKKESA